MSIPTILRFPAALACLAAGMVLAPAAGAQEVCEGYGKHQRIERLGGANTFARTGAHSPGQLLEGMNKYRAEIEMLMRQHGFGDDVINGLYETVRTGRGLSERKFERGEVVQWMFWRKAGKPMATGPMCFASNKTYEAYEIQVAIEEPHPGDAKCAVTATPNCDAGTIMVDAAGSSAGAEVKMGNEVVIPKGGTMTRKEVPYADRYTGTPSFTVYGEDRGSMTVRTYTFVVPKICLNLAYVGDATTERPGGGSVDTCTASYRVPKACPDPTPPACVLTVDPNLVKVGESVSIDASGHWSRDGLKLEAVDRNGTVVQTFSSVPASVTFAEAGTYTIRGTATNEVGDKADCNAVAVRVKRDQGRWTLRGYGFGIDVDDDVVMTSTIGAGGRSERTKLGFGNGAGVGLGLEYMFNDLVGLEGDVLYGEIESTFVFDIDNEWELDRKDVSMLSFLIGPNFHLTRNSEKVDFFIGPYVGISDFGDATYRALGRTFNRDYGDGTVWGVRFGVDFLFGTSPWALHLGGRYMDAQVEINNVDDLEIDVDPIMLGIGFAYRF